MTVVSPVSIADLFKELGGLEPDAIDQAQRLERALRAEVERDPSCSQARIGLIEIFRRQGKAVEALEQAEAAWRERERLADGLRFIFQAQLAGLGEYERARVLLDTMGRDAWKAAYLNKLVAINLGDWGFSDFGPPGVALETKFKALGLQRVFSWHQEVVRKALRGRQVLATFELLPSGSDADDAPDLSQYYFVASSYIERRSLEDGIHDELMPMYAAAGVEPGAAWDALMPMIMDVRAAPFTFPA